MRTWLSHLGGLILVLPVLAQPAPVFTIDQNGTDACYGQLFDSGGPEGDYGDNEYHVFTICPAERPSCLLFELSYYDIAYTESGTSDQLLLYDGPTIDPTKLLAAIGGSNFAVGTEGGGGVCYRVAAASGCLTVQFASDGVNTFSGFAGRWSCQDEACPSVQPLNLDLVPASSAMLAALETPSAPLSLLNFSCDSASYALFRQGDQTELGIGEGVLLSSGEASYALGPNDSDGFANFFTADRGQVGDADLDSLSVRQGNGFLSQDACLLELAVSPNSNVLEFDYVFASEEYPDYVLQEYNDIFAFLVSGPGITGIPWLGDQTNIATLPDGTVVEINSVNNQFNWPYFRDNTNGQGLQYDGLTADSLGERKALVARTPVQPCSTYTLKLAIADRGDGVFDSGVFIGKVRGGSPDLALDFANGLGVLSEACGRGGNVLTISYDNPGSELLRFLTTVSGSASLGQDYTLNLPAELSFPPGYSSYTFDLEVLLDNDDREGTEDIRITLAYDYGCGTPLRTTLALELEDFATIDILAPDSITLCAEDTLSLAADGPGPYRWSPLSWIAQPTDSVAWVVPDTAGWVYLRRRRSAACQWTDSVYVDLVNEADQISIQASDTTFCQGDSLWLFAVNSGAAASLSWSTIGGVPLGFGDSIGLLPLQSETVRLSYFIEACPLESSFFLQVDSLPSLSLVTDTLLCPDEELRLAPAGGNWLQIAGPNPGAQTAVLSITASQLNSPADRQRTYTFARSEGACQSLDSLRVTRLAPATLGIDTTVRQWPTATEQLSVMANPNPSWITEAISWETDTELVGTGSEISFSPEDYDYPTYLYAYYVDDCQQILDSIRIEYALLLLPNFFSPNNDGVNDEFRPFSPQPFGYYDLTIYNRWGQLVYAQQGSQPPVWTGEINGQPAPADVYLYRLYARRGERELTRQGNVSLLR